MAMLERDIVIDFYLGSWMSGLVSGLQNQPHPFESGTTLNSNFINDFLLDCLVKLL